MMETKIDFLYLNEPDMIRAGVLDMAGCVDTMIEMFKLMSDGDYIMGGANRNSHGIMLSFPESSPFPNMPLDGPDRRYMAMPAYLGGEFDMAGMKWYGSNTSNKEKGLPRSILTVMLNDKETGAPMALMSANILSAIRTGAIPGVGAKYLARKNSRVVGIIGPGVMNKTALASFMVTCPTIDTIKINGRRRATAEAYADYVKKEFPQIKTIEIVDTMEAAVRGSDIVSVATSGSVGSESYPYIKEEWIKPGTLFCMPANVRFDDDFILNRARNVVDNFKLYEAWSEELPAPRYEIVGLLAVHYMDLIEKGIMKPEDVSDLGNIIAGRTPARQSEDEIILYTVGGMPVEDIAWGTRLYRKALEKGIGTKLNLWDEPYLA
ncbi:tyramine oxidase subunit B [Acetobacterium carbinolicum]|uniref:tyramine oxidase subunit B n=1 Tax=Acetobacterium carbinolicum TaxID=52690 RepID=UPI0039C99069